MRKRYIEDKQFLSSSYSPRQTRFYTTDLDRTYESAYSYASGFYPPGSQSNTNLTTDQQLSARLPFANPKINFDSIEQAVGGYPLPFNIQSIPILSDHDGNQ
jgi:hypothetical protein